MFPVLGLSACAHDVPRGEQPQNDRAVASVPCPKIDGIGYRLSLVSNEVVARGIALAVIDGVGLTNQPGKYELIVEDEMTHWAAYQSPTKSQEASRRGDLENVVMGGGGMSMRISKCDGAISHVYFQR
jgi:hypothetical protein